MAICAIDRTKKTYYMLLWLQLVCIRIQWMAWFVFEKNTLNYRPMNKWHIKQKVGTHFLILTIQQWLWIQDLFNLRQSYNFDNNSEFRFILFLAVCPGGCIPNSICVRPSMCRCIDGYTGPKCKVRQLNHMSTTSSRAPIATGSSLEDVAVTSATNDLRPVTLSRCLCLNGGRCINHMKRCKCPPNYHGHRCEHGKLRRSRTLNFD